MSGAMNPRLNRLFAPDGHCFDVAVDHGLFGEWRFLEGIEDARKVVTTLATAQPDAIQLSFGQAPFLQALHMAPKPSLVLRTDVANVYGRTGASREYLFSELLEGAVERAVQLDATAVVVNILALPGYAELQHACLKNVAKLRALSEPFGLPLMVEPLAMKPGRHGYDTDGNTQTIVSLVRQATEMGADVIKADPTDNLSDYPKVIEAAGGRPVLVRGGGRVSDEALLLRTVELMATGASGIVYGRNVIQHANPVAIATALMAIVHDNATAEQALKLCA